MSKVISRNSLIVTYITLVFLALILPGYGELIQTILEMQRNTIHFSSLDILSLLDTQATLHITQYFVLAFTLTAIFIYLIFRSALITSKLLSKYVSPVIVYLTLPLFSILGLIQFNSITFPYSSHFYYDLAELGRTSIISLTLLSTFIFCLMAPIVLFTINHSRKHYLQISVISGLALASLFFTTAVPSTNHQTNDVNKKNIIIIGIDSFRMDHIHTNMPFLQSLLKKSEIHSNSYTPFARTYPAWSTILSGQYPPTSGARYNLINETLQPPTSGYLPNILKKHNYKTIYASDERRFSQIGKKHGFDEVVGPRAGLSNFVLGQYADYPITNLLTLFNNSSYFFPELTLNRAASHLYDPMSFTDKLNRKINKLNENTPLFLAVHHCMPHWPFHHGKHIDNTNKNDEASQGYHYSLSSVDMQIKSLWQTLEKNNLIKNSIIFFVSDHGESWQEYLTFTKDNGKIIEFYTNGHGSNIISENEHRVMLARYNPEQQKPTESIETVTLADIAPTILGMINLPTKYSEKMDGTNMLTNKSPDKIFPVESGFTIRAITQADINVEQALAQAASRYEIQKDGTLRIKIEEIPFLNQGKRVAVRNKSHLMTYQRVNNESFKRMLVLDLENSTAVELSPNDRRYKELLSQYCLWYPEYLLNSGHCSPIVSSHANL